MVALVPFCPFCNRIDGPGPDGYANVTQRRQSAPKSMVAKVTGFWDARSDELSPYTEGGQVCESLMSYCEKDFEN